MCCHRRIIFACGHYVWGPIVRPCPDEKAFHQGKLDMGCNQMWSDVLTTVHTTPKCKKCAAAEAKTGAQVAVIKEKIRLLHELVDKISQHKAKPTASMKLSTC
ncbi:hypothetical protein B0H66DRAFT_528154 [Apodospora peruviana]|uniref:Uncharacterized protein n=1 Tax=Apodospora peruviana TaxID=516989 RepID=A0AAE0ITG7_9PEZI|nr:hypothetical protein B0H66DRAFT_528154 [Apodospora peruviana]